MPYIGNKTADTTLVEDNSITSAKIVNDSVIESKLNLISTSSVPSLEAKGTSGVTEGYIQLNCAENSHGIKLKSPPHSAGASYTLTFPNNDGNANQFLQTNGSGVLSFADVSSGGFLGDGQTWQNVTSSRSAGTFYTNSTGKPIQIFAVFGNIGTGAEIRFYYIPSGGSEIQGSGIYTNSSSGRHSVTFTIPDGDQYKIYGSGSQSKQQWWELR